MDIRRLSAFVRIYETESITRTAEEFGVAQPALSQQLAVLEREVGARLFERSRRGVTPTPAGHVLYARANVVLRMVGEFGEAVKRSAEELSGGVAVGLLPTVSGKVGLPLFEELRKSHPHVTLQLRIAGERELAQELLDGRSDMAILSQVPKHGDLHAAKWITEPLVFLSSLDFPEGFSDSPAQFADVPWVSSRPGHSVRRIVDAALTREGLSANVVAEIDSLDILVASVEAGLGVSVLPISAVPAGARLRAEPFFNLTRSLYLCRRAWLTPAAERVLALLRASAGLMNTTL